MHKYGIYRICQVSPKVEIGNVKANAGVMSNCIMQAVKEGADAVVFPRLALTSASCGDYFKRKKLADEAMAGLLAIAKATAKSDVLSVIGLPVKFRGKRYDCAAFLRGGEVICFVPSTVTCGKLFSSGQDLDDEILLPDGSTSFISPGVVVELGDELRITAETGRDAGAVVPPVAEAVAAGANVIFSLSSNAAGAGMQEYSDSLILGQSSRFVCACFGTSAGAGETTSDSVCSGRLIAAENGKIIAENEGLSTETNVLFTDVDLGKTDFLRGVEEDFAFSVSNVEGNSTVISLDPPKDKKVKVLKYRPLSTLPFVPEDTGERKKVCERVFRIQTLGLAKRLTSSRAENAVIGISGGLDSTCALLAAVEAMKTIGKKAKNVIAVTMPGFGTTKKTKNNALELAKLLGCTVREIGIAKACIQHFSDIGQDKNKHDVTYENTQARERTQILMDVANMLNGIVIGTGDLSEAALGWCTYNGDHMAMYSVNSSIPKTLLRAMAEEAAKRLGGKAAKVLRDVVATPISPELLPSGKAGKIVQKTEDIVGHYELHDFFIHHAMRGGADPEKLFFLAKNAFKGIYPESEIKKALSTFKRRFVTQEFKRACSPEGAGTGSISFSPRTSWHVPSDASTAVFGEDLK